MDVVFRQHLLHVQLEIVDCYPFQRVFSFIVNDHQLCIVINVPNSLDILHFWPINQNFDNFLSYKLNYFDLNNQIFDQFRPKNQNVDTFLNQKPKISA